MGIRELKQNASAVVAIAKSGDAVTITEHGNPVAMLIPYPEDFLTRLELEGKLVRATHADLASWLQENPPLEASGPTIEEILTETRADRHLG